MNSAMTAIVKKDLYEITANRRMLLTLLIVPLVLTVLLPVVFVLLIYFVPEEASDFQSLLALLPPQASSAGFERTASELVFNHILPVFFLIVPVMESSVMSASSFVGEKEKSTLETLLYSPLSLKQIFRAKVLASFLLSMAVSLLSFFLMLFVFETVVLLLSGGLILPGIEWLLIMLLVSPALSMIAITLIVRVSVKAQSVEDAQQGAVFLLLPVLALVIGQFAGMLLISAWILLGIGCLCALLAGLLMKKAMGRFGYEQFLKR